jgi:hypothetical protein
MRYGKSESVPLVPTSDGDWVRHSDHLKTEGERDKWIDLTGYWREQAENARHRADHAEQLLASEQEKRERAEGSIELFRSAMDRAEEMLPDDPIAAKGLLAGARCWDVRYEAEPWEIAVAEELAEEDEQQLATARKALTATAHPAPEPPEEKRRREQELHPDLDLDAIEKRAAELRAAPSDAAAIRMVLDKEPAPSPAEQIEEAVEAVAQAMKTRCCSFSDGDGSGPSGWADREYRRVAREILEPALPFLRNLKGGGEDG